MVSARALFRCASLCWLAAILPPPGWSTEPFPPTVIREKSNGEWQLDGQYLGGARIYVVDAKDETRLFLEIHKALPGTDYQKYVDQTTAGPQWEEYAIHYFLTIKQSPHFCVKTWWGTRILLNLETARQVSDRELDDVLSAEEKRLVLDRLRAWIELVKAKNFRSGESRAAIHHAGQMKLREAIPLLQQLEESTYVTESPFMPKFDIEGRDFVPCRFAVYGVRRFAQLALRRMGVKPAGYPATSCRTWLENRETETDATLKLDPPRAERVALIKEGMKPLEVVEKLGSPDYIERWKGDDDVVVWRYDVDASPPFSLLLIINNQRVESVERWPGLWHGNDLIPPNVERHVFDPDGSIDNMDVFRAHYGKLDPSQQASVDSGHFPVAWIIGVSVGVLALAFLFRWWRFHAWVD